MAAAEDPAEEVKDRTVLQWVMQRLRGLGMDPRGRRRVHVLKLYTSLVVSEAVEFSSAHSGQLLEVAIRARMTITGPEEKELKQLKELSDELLEQLEQKLGSAAFIGLYSDIQRRVESSKTSKRRIEAATAVSDPKLYAQRRLAKRAANLKSRKRKATHGDMKSGKVRGMAYIEGDDGSY
jgi:hypothetical protein